MKDEINNWKNSNVYKLFKKKLEEKNKKLLNMEFDINNIEKTDLSWAQIEEQIRIKNLIFCMQLNEKMKFEEENYIPKFYSNNKFDQILLAYIKNIIYWTFYLNKSIKEERYEISAKIREIIIEEEKEEIRKLMIYHFDDSFINVKKYIDYVYKVKDIAYSRLLEL